jgi:phosphoribosylanthranilate isomerase
MTWIKICGITNLKDALEAATLGVNALGFIFAPSPRRIDPSAAREIIASLPAAIEKVGVFVDEDSTEVRRIADLCGLDTLQFHGKEPPEYCRQFSRRVIKTIGVRNSESLKDMDRYPSVTILLDTCSDKRAVGTGETFEWEWAREAHSKRDFILSGGLNPGNVYRAIRLLQPKGVDVSSGVEKIPGEKDSFKMIGFVQEVRKAVETAAKKNLA